MPSLEENGRAPSDGLVDRDHHETEGLERSHLRPVQLVALALTSQTPAVALATVPFLLVVTAGNGSWLAALLAVAATVCVGVPVTAFARRYVVTGSIYSYLPHVFGPWARLLAGAALLLGFITLLAGVLLLTGIFAGSFAVSIGIGSGLSASTITAVSIIAVVIAAGMAYRGLDASVRTAVILTILTVPMVVVVTVAAAINGGVDLSDQLTLRGVSLSGIVQGVAAGTVFLVAFESSAALAVETRNPRRNVPLAVMCIPVILGGLYVVAAILQVPSLLAARQLLDEGVSPAAALALEAGLGKGMAEATDLVLAIANLASLIAFVNYGSRFIATLATDGLLPAPLARVHPRFKGPNAAIIGLAASAECFLLVLVWSYPDDLLTKVFPSISTLTVYMWLVPWILICAGAVRLAARENVSRPALIACATVGATAMAWVYVNGLVNPPASPVDAMSYVFIIALAVTVTLFAVINHRSTGRHRTSSHGPTPGQPNDDSAGIATQPAITAGDVSK